MPDKAEGRPAEDFEGKGALQEVQEERVQAAEEKINRRENEFNCT